jgi:hypothetical protein
VTTQIEVVDIVMCMEDTPEEENIDRFGAGTVSASQPNDAIVRYGKDEIRA